MQQQHQQPAEIKLLLIGNSSVGKTSLLLRFSDSRWFPENEAIATTGIDVKVREMEVGGKNVLLSVWDTAGQERYRTITSSYYRGAQGVILVYDVTSRKTFDALARWYADIESKISTPVVKVLIGNKVDKESSRAVSTLEGEAYARRMGSLFVEASAKTGAGVTETFRVVVEKILETPPLAREELEGVKLTLRSRKGVVLDRERRGTGDDKKGCGCRS